MSDRLRPAAAAAPMIFCTLFNRLYLPQGLALYRSLEATAGGRFVLHVLCMDDFTADILDRMALPGMRTIRLAAFEDDALRAAKASRSVGEYCWTCTGPLLLHVQDLYPPGTVVAYVDADIRFFSDPRAILDELGERSIFVHEHDFAPAHAHYLPVAGRFNVGVVAVRNDAEGRACLERWRNQCLDECVMDPAQGKCGDQNYLDEWPERYPGLVISANPGIGLGPWNIDKHRLGGNPESVLVDGVPVVFYHYHALRLWRPRPAFRALLMARGAYSFAPDVVSLLYRPYARDLWRALAAIDRLDRTVSRGLEPASWRDLHAAHRKRQLCFAVGFRA